MNESQAKTISPLLVHELLVVLWNAEPLDKRDGATLVVVTGALPLALQPLLEVLVEPTDEVKELCVDPSAHELGRREEGAALLTGREVLRRHHGSPRGAANDDGVRSPYQSFRLGHERLIFLDRLHALRHVSRLPHQRLGGAQVVRIWVPIELSVRGPRGVVSGVILLGADIEQNHITLLCHLAHFLGGQARHAFPSPVADQDFPGPGPARTLP
mmetsp:Transcript_7706/g.21984  ORF Transcript_7706/g.21984 Transcript_7706/m.21984 type:complete len:214 (+) Transcript_7706:1206-1847(+)